jgi:DNA repair protein RadC
VTTADSTREIVADPALAGLSGLAQVLREGGAPSLSDLDILSLVLGSPGRPARGAARRILKEGHWGELTTGPTKGMWWEALAPRHGVRLALALELARRLGAEGRVDRLTVNGPRDVFEATADLRFHRREHFVGLYLDTRNKVTARETISVGSLNASIVHPREVFEPALRHGAAHLVVVHNHPSGETDPSEDDLRITRRLQEAGEILGLELLDHVIVGRKGFTSLKELGAL